MKTSVTIAAIATASLLSIGISHSQQAAPADAPRYVPGIGEFMLSAQTRHAKLWLAGSAQNWDLADYLIDEIKEGLEDAAKYVPTLKDVPIGKMIDSIMEKPIADMEQAIKAKDRGGFVSAFDRLTAACNGCHEATGRPFLVMQRPSNVGFPNQSFAPLKR